MPAFNSSTNLLIPVVLFAGLLGCLEFSFWLGSRALRKENENSDPMTTIQGAMLGLLALLLGFTFALAAGRFSNRIALITDEANAIGSVWWGSDVLPEARRDEIREKLRQYVELRIHAYDARTEDEWESDMLKTEAMQRQI
jgi:hypothetical protein